MGTLGHSTTDEAISSTSSTWSSPSHSLSSFIARALLRSRSLSASRYRSTESASRADIRPVQGVKSEQTHSALSTPVTRRHSSKLALNPINQPTGSRHTLAVTTPPINAFPASPPQPPKVRPNPPAWGVRAPPSHLWVGGLRLTSRGTLSQASARPAVAVLLSRHVSDPNRQRASAQGGEPLPDTCTALPPHFWVYWIAGRNPTFHFATNPPLPCGAG